ncbi:5-aminolevulinate synthase [Mycena venus]|uniref:5-aminolevulinate synthase n=1 Tax=Mycena venus TaxID=2733690 RepID=A0A8H7CYW8_9AGAR|nr:5-aminolevulinate synthase [Mycena venus]
MNLLKIELAPGTQRPPKHREPDEGILEHERKRKVEVKCLELQLQLEDEGLDEEKVEEQVSALREKLLANLASMGPSGGRIKPSDTHAMAAAKKDELSKMASAFGTRANYVEGDAFNREKQEELRIKRQEEREERDRRRDAERARMEEQKAKWEAEKKERDRLRRLAAGVAALHPAAPALFLARLPLHLVPVSVLPHPHGPRLALVPDHQPAVAISLPRLLAVTVHLLVVTVHLLAVTVRLLVATDRRPHGGTDPLPAATAVTCPPPLAKDKSPPPRRARSSSTVAAAHKIASHAVKPLDHILFSELPKISDVCSTYYAVSVYPVVLALRGDPKICYAFTLSCKTA